MDIVSKDNMDSGNRAEVVLYQPDNSIHIEVLMEGETVWLTAQQMALLFSRDDSNIRRHIINIFKDGELQQENNVHFLHVNGVKKPVPYYNLDVIISVGYRVHSPQGAAFRIWATRIIKQYLLHGFAIRQQLWCNCKPIWHTVCTHAYAAQKRRSAVENERCSAEIRVVSND